MVPSPTVSSGLVAGLLDYAGRRGIDRDALSGAAGLTPAGLDDPDRRLPLVRYLDLIRMVRERTGDPALALHFGQEMGMAEMSIVGLIMEASATMGEAFAQMQRYGRLAVDGADAGPLRTRARRGAALPGRRGR